MFDNHIALIVIVVAVAGAITYAVLRPKGLRNGSGSGGRGGVDSHER